MHRIALEPVPEKRAAGTLEDLLDGYPRITREDVHAASQFAADTLAHEEVVFRPTGAERLSFSTTSTDGSQRLAGPRGVQ
ncbi:MAG: hypothetical protein NTV05_06885 [Acidobacteria bacterium]|nr:hypothetical protein [Acidobacteriota bacterium]